MLDAPWRSSPGPGFVLMAWLPSPRPSATPHVPWWLSLRLASLSRRLLPLAARPHCPQVFPAVPLRRGASLPTPPFDANRRHSTPLLVATTRLMPPLLVANRRLSTPAFPASRRLSTPLLVANRRLSTPLLVASRRLSTPFDANPGRPHRKLGRLLPVPMLPGPLPLLPTTWTGHASPPLPPPCMCQAAWLLPRARLPWPTRVACRPALALQRVPCLMPTLCSRVQPSRRGPTKARSLLRRRSPEKYALRA